MRSTLVTWLLALSLGSALMAEEPAVDLDQYREPVQAILREALTRGQTHDRLQRLCTLAPHRLGGSPGSAAAVEWARQEMKRLGLEDVRLEPCMVPHWERGEVEELRIEVPASTGGEQLPILALGGSIATPPEGITAGLIAVQSFEELQERAGEARGKIVLFNRPMDSSLPLTFAAYGGAVNQRVHGAVEAAKVGAVAALVRSMTTRLDDVPHTGTMRYREGVNRIPTAAVSTLGAERLAALLAAGEAVRVHLRLACQWHEDAPSANVVGEYRGREVPEEILVVGGHLDSWDVGQGAHDDGGGCCQSLEVVRLLQALHLRPRRTIRVVLFANEENGTRGARAYHEAHREEMARHVLALESDSGVFTPRGFSCDTKDPATRATLEGIAGLLEEIGAGRVREGGGGVDVGVMARSGVVTMGYRSDCQRYFDVHHAETDTLEAVNPREIELGSAAMAAMLYVLADLPDRIPPNPVEKRDE